jgi:hypothetical protein
MKVIDALQQTAILARDGRPDLLRGDVNETAP